MSDRRRQSGLAVAAAGCLLVALGGGLLLRPEAPRDVGFVPPTTVVLPVAASRTLPPRRLAAAARPAPKARAVPPARAVPAALRMPRLGVSASVVPVTVGAAGSLGVPADPRVLGWWQSGARPGAGRGSIVVDGHVDNVRVGAGALFTVRRSRPGDAVGVRDATGRWWSYVVTGVRHYRKQHLPAAEVFAQGGPERLVLITCGGAFDRRTRQYSDNVVVYAVPARPGTPPGS